MDAASWYEHIELTKMGQQQHEETVTVECYVCHKKILATKEMAEFLEQCHANLICDDCSEY